MKHLLVPLPVALLLTGCVPPRALSPTIDAQANAMTALRASYDADLALLSSHLASAIALRRQLLIGRIDRELVELGYLNPDTGPQQLREDLANPVANNVLVNDLRAGRLTLVAADRLLSDYRASESLTPSLATEVRDNLLTPLDPLRKFDDASATLRAAVDEHAQDVAWLFDEAERSSQSLHVYAGQEPRWPQAVAANAPELWSRFVLSRISDPARRAEAEQLLNELVSLATASLDRN